MKSIDTGGRLREEFPVMAAVPLQAVTFNLVGALLLPQPSLGSRIAAALRRRGCEVDSLSLQKRIPNAERNARKGRPYPCDDDGEAALLRATLRGVIAGDGPPEVIAAVEDEVAADLATAKAWRTPPEAAATLDALRFLGLRLGVVANAPGYMRGVMKERGLLQYFDHIALSAETGVPKPDRRAFMDAAFALGLSPGEILHVGDSPENDIRPAIANGLRACLISDEEADWIPGSHRVATLKDFRELVQRELVSDMERRRSEFGRPARNMIADLHGLPEDDSLSEEKPVSSPSQIAGLLARALDGNQRAVNSIANLARSVLEADQRGLDPMDAIQDDWESLLTPRLRGKCFPVAVEHNALVVLFSSTSARQDFQMMERAFLRALQRLDGCAGITRCFYRM